LLFGCQITQAEIKLQDTGNNAAGQSTEVTRGKSKISESKMFISINRRDYKNIAKVKMICGVIFTIYG